MMRLLLDTHTLIWFDAEPDRLSDISCGVLADENNLLLISIASIWEMQIKIQTGRLNLRLPLSVLIDEQTQNAGLQILPIEPRGCFKRHRLFDSALNDPP